MAVGGMVGGGIFSVLGVVIDTAAQWAWLSFAIGGLIALIAAYSYSKLAIIYQEGGGAFTFLREINHKGFAGSLSWVLLLGYLLTVSVYAFTFGHYVAHVFHAGAWLPRVLAVAIIAVFVFINLQGVSNSSKAEIITVWGKLFVLIGLAAFGLADWDSAQITKGVASQSWHMAIVGAASIFVAYEGFQLLSYDYNDLKNPDKTLPRATISAVLAVLFIYIIVTFGCVMLVGADTLVEQKEVALSVAGKAALGTVGLVLVTIAAAFSTGSAINATLFSTGRLMEKVAEKKDLPHLFAKENSDNIPYYSIIFLGGFAALLAAIGNLSTLVDAASLVFLLTFGTVSYLAFKQKVKYRFFCLFGSLACGAAIVLSTYEQFKKNPIPISIVIGLILLIFIGRPIVLKQMNARAQ